MDPTTTELVVDSDRLARRVLIGCVAAEILFVFLDYYVVQWTSIGALRRMFNIAREDGVASWFGTVQTLMAGLTLGLIYLAVKKRPGTRRVATGWLVLSVFFVYMAVDDGVQLHERLGSIVAAVIGPSLEFFPSYPWQLILLPFFAALGVFMLVFLWRQLEAPSSKLLLLAAISMQSFAVGLDFFEGLDAAHRWNPYTAISSRYDLELWTQARFSETAYTTLQHFSRSIEEALEMLAISICWFLFLRQLGVVVGELRIRFSTKA